MTTKKRDIDKNTLVREDDDYYAVEKKRIAEETQKAHKIHELEVQSHLTAMIPHYEEAEGDDGRRLLFLNKLLINRFEEPGMMYWNIFRNAPREIRDYSDLFEGQLNESDIQAIIHFLEQKKEEAANMVDMWFDEDGEEDDLKPQKEEDNTVDEDSVPEEE